MIELTSSRPRRAEAVDPQGRRGMTIPIARFLTEFRALPIAASVGPSLPPGSMPAERRRLGAGGDAAPRSSPKRARPARAEARRPPRPAARGQREAALAGRPTPASWSRRGQPGSSRKASALRSASAERLDALESRIADGVGRRSSSRCCRKAIGRDARSTNCGPRSRRCWPTTTAGRSWSAAAPISSRPIERPFAEPRRCSRSNRR